MKFFSSAPAVALLAALRRRGVELAIGPTGTLRYRPVDALTDADLATLRAHKAEVLGLLAGHDDAVAEAGYRLDPRPDLVYDHGLWVRLLARAYGLDGHQPNGLYGAFHGLRCLGARLADDGHGLRLVPGDISGDEYAALRARWLVPHRDALVGLLRGMHDGGAS